MLKKDLNEVFYGLVEDKSCVFLKLWENEFDPKVLKKHSSFRIVSINQNK